MRKLAIYGAFLLGLSDQSERLCAQETSAIQNRIYPKLIVKTKHISEALYVAFDGEHISKDEVEKEYRPYFTPKSKEAYRHIMDQRKFVSVFYTRIYTSDITADLETLSAQELQVIGDLSDIYKQSNDAEELLLAVKIDIPKGVPQDILDELLENAGIPLEYVSKYSTPVGAEEVPNIQIKFLTLRKRTKTTINSTSTTRDSTKTTIKTSIETIVEEKGSE